MASLAAAAAAASSSRLFTCSCSLATTWNESGQQNHHQQRHQDVRTLQLQRRDSGHRASPPEGPPRRHRAGVAWRCCCATWRLSSSSWLPWPVRALRRRRKGGAGVPSTRPDACLMPAAQMKPGQLCDEKGRRAGGGKVVDRFEWRCCDMARRAFMLDETVDPVAPSNVTLRGVSWLTLALGADVAALLDPLLGAFLAHAGRVELLAWRTTELFGPFAFMVAPAMQRMRSSSAGASAIRASFRQLRDRRLCVSAWPAAGQPPRLG